MHLLQHTMRAKLAVWHSSKVQKQTAFMKQMSSML